MKWGLLRFGACRECIKKECFSAPFVSDNFFAETFDFNAEALDVSGEVQRKKIGVDLGQRVEDGFVEVNVVIHRHDHGFGGVDNLLGEDSVDSSHSVYLLLFCLFCVVPLTVFIIHQVSLFVNTFFIFFISYFINNVC